MIELRAKRVMVLAPHTDDGEFGCGGTLARLREEGTEIFYTAFSVCEQSVPYGFEKDELERELFQATAALQVPPENVIVHRYQVRTFPAHRQEILQHVIEDRDRIRPDLVLMPCLDDLHQDHQVIAAEGLRAYKNTTILSYEMPWNNLNINTSAFMVLQERHVLRKVEALACYRTQTFRHYANEEFVRALARTRGAQVAQRYAEVFQLVRLVA
ncbi:MAG: PIG-L family deacetylase [Gemmatimonadetes bacterium]|nr:PIG-L family deacetylase [Gemmatimonadota bacterium]